ncbi:hypothetical protein T484DRAFT_1904163, partial [Baffinella frigidus]
MADPESWFSLLSLDDSLPHRSPQQEPQAWSGGVSSVVAPHPSAGNGGLFGYQAVASLGEGAAAFFTDGLRVDFSQFRTASDPVDIVAPHPSAGEDQDCLPPTIREPHDPSPWLHDSRDPHPSASTWDGEEGGWGGGDGEQDSDGWQHGEKKGSRLKWWDGFSATATIVEEGYTEGGDDGCPDEVPAEPFAPQLHGSALEWSGIPYTQVGGERPSYPSDAPDTEWGATPPPPLRDARMVPRSLHESYRELVARETSHQPMAPTSASHTQPLEGPAAREPSLQAQYLDLMAAAGAEAGAAGG